MVMKLLYLGAVEDLEGWLGDENTGGVDWLGMSRPLGKKLLLDLPSRSSKSSRSSMEEWTEAKEEEISFREEEDSISSSALLSSSCRG